jgi:hypothetical protein
MKKSALLLIFLLPGLALAEGDWAITAKAGTLGLGGELTTRLSETAQLRFGLNGFNFDTTRTEDGVKYDTTFRQFSAGLTGDLFPIQDSVFRLSLGLFYNDNRLDMTAKPRRYGYYEFQGHTYSSREIGKLSGRLTFNKASPYIGVGWGNAFAKPAGWSFVLDAGVLYQGRPKFRLSSDSAICNADAQCQADIANQQADSERSLRFLRWYPVISAGAAYRF